MLDDVRREALNIVPQLAFSANGVLAYVPGDDMGVSTPVWVDRTGAEEAILLHPDRYGPFDISPDGRQLAIQIDGTTSDVWLYDFERATDPRRLTLGGNNGTPQWTPDGRRVTFASDRMSSDQTTPGGIFWQAVNGGPAEWLTGGIGALPGSWTQDGVLAFMATSAAADQDILVITGQDSTEPEFVVQTPSSEWNAVFSPDDRWIAYTSDESGQNEVYVKRYPPTDERWPVSTDFGKEPVWSRKGDELFFTKGGDVWSVAVRTDSWFTPEVPERLVVALSP